MRVNIILSKDVADRDAGIALIQQVKQKLASYPGITVDAMIVDDVDVDALPAPPD